MGHVWKLLHSKKCKHVVSDTNSVQIQIQGQIQIQVANTNTNMCCKVMGNLLIEMQGR